MTANENVVVLVIGDAGSPHWAPSNPATASAVHTGDLRKDSQTVDDNTSVTHRQESSNEINNNNMNDKDEINKTQNYARH